ncbi:hypothetical protein SK128_023223 [Halocaridina rubra]|uniref:Uncharacterized protein n=1 Tax=Halocaridina rubra TaxID=373956 RepID=A0AAN8WWK8_HALRR
MAFTASERRPHCISIFVCAFKTGSYYCCKKFLLDYHMETIYPWDPPQEVQVEAVTWIPKMSMFRTGLSVSVLEMKFYQVTGSCPCVSMDTNGAVRTRLN